MKNDYGPKTNNHTSMDKDMYIPGSPDARMYGSGDMYDRMPPISGFGNKVSTTKNKTGTGAPNTGIQGNATRGKSGNTQHKTAGVKGTGKTHKSSYSAAVLDNSPTADDSKEYGKGQNKTGMNRKRTRGQGA